jgi:hypothetical protein
VAPDVKADEAVALALVEVNDVTGLEPIDPPLHVIRAPCNTDRTLDDPPDLGTARVVLPGEPVARFDQQDLRAERDVVDVVDLDAREEGLDEAVDGVGVDHQEAAPGTRQVLVDDRE